MSFSCLFSKASEGVRWFPFYLFMILSSLKDDLYSFFLQLFYLIPLELGRMVGNVYDYASSSWYSDPIKYSHQAFARYKNVSLQKKLF